MPEARGLIRKISAERIEILYAASVKAYPKEIGLSRGYIKLLLEIGRHYKVKIPAGMAAHICKECNLPLIEGINCQTRIIAKEKRVIYRCLGCGGTNSLGFDAMPKGAGENQISIIIDAPVKKVFKFTIDPKNTHLWVPGMVKEEANEAKIRVGTRYRNVNKEKKWSEYIVAEFKPDKTFAMEQVNSPYRVRYTYEKLGTKKTKLTYFEWVTSGTIEGPFDLSVLGKLKEIIEQKG